jgi:hypothetical protein
MNELEHYFELTNGITVEELKSLYFDADALKIQPRPVYRVGGTSERVYYTFDQSGEPFFYESVTTGLGKVLPTSPHLIKWIAETGMEEAELFKNERADYGTFLHIECSTLLINKGVYDLDKVREKLKQYIDEKQLPDNFIYHEEELKKDILSFAQWCIDYKVKPLAIEIVLADEEIGMGGALDLPCEITYLESGFYGEVYKSGVQKGLPKESKKEVTVRAIVDLKSGRKGFYDSHVFQLEIYRMIWNKHYPDMEIKKTFNWSPKEWRGSTPTYNFKDQSDSKELDKMPFILGMIAVERSKRKNSLLVCSGEINLANKSLDSNHVNLHLSELVKMQRGGQDA